MFRRRDPAHHAAIDRVAGFTRAHFRLPDDVTVSVAELECAVPGCPPVETVIVFWTAPDRRHHWKVFKPVAEVTQDDLPPWWMRDRLVDTGDCDCC